MAGRLVFKGRKGLYQINDNSSTETLIIDASDGSIRGDIQATAGSIGTTELANDGVTYAKIQNVSATNRLLGRSTSGAGDVEEITVGGDISQSGSNFTLGANVVTLAKFARSDASGKIIIGQGASADSQYAVLSGDVTMDGSGVVTTRKVGGVPRHTQANPAAKTVTAAITGAELVAGLITTTGASAPSIHQLPNGTDIDAAISGVANGDAFDFYIINTGTGASDDATITTNTGLTLVGNMTVGALTDATIISGSGHFRAIRTGTATYSVVRLA